MFYLNNTVSKTSFTANLAHYGQTWLFFVFKWNTILRIFKGM